MTDPDDGPCNVCIESDYDGDSVSFHQIEHVKARKSHRCCECGDTIPKGAVYERVVGKWDRELSTYKTCAACEDVRNNLCYNGWTYTMLWESAVESEMFEHLTTGCLEQLGTAAGKAKLLEKWREWKGL